MIRSFKCKETEKLFNGSFSSKLPQSIQRSAAIKLEIINAATVLETLRVPPSNHLEKLRRNRKGQHCIRIIDLCIKNATITAKKGANRIGESTTEAWIGKV